MGRGWKTKAKYLIFKSDKKYHNESNVVFGGDNEALDEEEKKKRDEERRKKEEELNSKLPTYDPKSGGRSNVHFGDEKPDYRRKDEVATSVKVHNPPGGRSNIQFGWSPILKHHQPIYNISIINTTKIMSWCESQVFEFLHKAMQDFPRVWL